jgi:hypothetical protein
MYCGISGLVRGGLRVFSTNSSFFGVVYCSPLSVQAAAAAILFRQTNSLWVGFIVVHQLESVFTRTRKKTDIVNLPAAVSAVVKQCWLHVLALFSFAGFVIYRGTIVLGTLVCCVVMP